MVSVEPEILEYYMREQLKEVQHLLEASPQAHFHKFEISLVHLMDRHPVTAHALIQTPSFTLPLFKQGIIEAQTKLFRILNESFPHRIGLSVKKNVIIRVHSLPPTPRIHKSTLSSLRSDDTEKLLQISGTVVKTSSVKMLEVSRIYRCMKGTCGYRFKVSADPEQDNIIEVPVICPATLQQQTGLIVCGGKNLREEEGTKECVDYQEIKIQDRIETLPFGSIPRSIHVMLESDLVDKLNPGDDVILVGILFRQWKQVRQGQRCEATLVFKAISYRTLNSYNSFKLYHSIAECRYHFELFWGKFKVGNKELLGRDLLIREMCPQLYGLYFVKLAALLTILGGSAQQKNEGVQSRANCHLLLIGDPGTGKSQLLSFIASLTPRSIQTTGVGTTGAGLTCTAVRNGSDWSLEAGALVLANGGIACIDEFTSMRESDRATIHEAMEQQTISVAKAGLLVKLDTKTSIVAACNPHGNYDPSLDLTANTLIGPALLSRFDLTLVLCDRVNKDWDKRVSTYLLKQAVGGMHEGTSQQQPSKRPTTTTTGVPVPVHFLREYVMYVREQINPAMSNGAKTLLTRYYQLQRQGDDMSASRTTVRLLESLLRLSEAHAKLMFRQVVTIQDAIVAISCMQLSQSSAQASILSADSMLQSDFPDDPITFYETMERDIVRRMHISAVDWEVIRKGEKEIVQLENSDVDTTINSSGTGSGTATATTKNTTPQLTDVSTLNNMNNMLDNRIASQQYYSVNPTKPTSSQTITNTSNSRAAAMHHNNNKEIENSPLNFSNSYSDSKLKVRTEKEESKSESLFSSLVGSATSNNALTNRHTNQDDDGADASALERERGEGNTSSNNQFLSSSMISNHASSSLFASSLLDDW